MSNHALRTPPFGLGEFAGEGLKPKRAIRAQIASLWIQIPIAFLALIGAAMGLVLRWMEMTIVGGVVCLIALLWRPVRRLDPADLVSRDPWEPEVGQNNVRKSRDTQIGTDIRGSVQALVAIFALTFLFVVVLGNTLNLVVVLVPSLPLVVTEPGIIFVTTILVVVVAVLIYGQFESLQDLVYSILQRPWIGSAMSFVLTLVVLVLYYTNYLAIALAFALFPISAQRRSISVQLRYEAHAAPLITFLVSIGIFAVSIIFGPRQKREIGRVEMWMTFGLTILVLLSITWSLLGAVNVVAFFLLIATALFAITAFFNAGAFRGTIGLSLGLVRESLQEIAPLGQIPFIVLATSARFLAEKLGILVRSPWKLVYLFVRWVRVRLIRLLRYLSSPAREAIDRLEEIQIGIIEREENRALHDQEEYPEDVDV